jgi:hypothetical protein
MMGDLKSLAAATDDDPQGLARPSPGLYVLAGKLMSMEVVPLSHRLFLSLFLCDCVHASTRVALLDCVPHIVARDIFTMLRSWEARHGSSGGLDKAGTPRLAVIASFFEIYANKQVEMVVDVVQS